MENQLEKDWHRITRAVQDDYERARDCGVENISFPRGDLGLLYQLLKDLEWSDRRKAWGLRQHGSMTRWQEVTFSACPQCGGVHPDQFKPAFLPASADSHSAECKLVAMIRLLRSALGASE